jgi:hypothetical protein
MKNHLKISALILVNFLFLQSINGQQLYPFSEEGYNYPVRTNSTLPPIKVLVVCVQMNGAVSSTIDCDAMITPCFPEDNLPIDIDKYFDSSIGTGGPVGYIVLAP